MIISKARREEIVGQGFNVIYKRQMWTGIFGGSKCVAPVLKLISRTGERESITIGEYSWATADRIVRNAAEGYALTIKED